MTATLDDNRPAHILPLEELNFRTWRGHKSALWWWKFWYCRPEKFRELLQRLAKESRSGALCAGAALLVSALPYTLLLAVAGRLALTVLIDGPPPWDAVSIILTATLVFGKTLAGGLVVGGFSGLLSGLFGKIISGINFNISSDIRSSLIFIVAFCLVIGIIFGLTCEIVSGLIYGVAIGVCMGFDGRFRNLSEGRSLDWFVLSVSGMIFFGLSGEIALRIGNGIDVNLFINLVSNFFGGLAVGVGIIICLFRLYNEPLHWLLMFPRPRGRFYRFHPAAWDEGRGVVYLGLHRLLVNYAAHDFDKASREIDRLIDLGPQAPEARKAFAILVSRDSANVSLSDIGGTLNILPEGDKGWLAQTKQVKQSAKEISALALQIDQLRQPVVRARAINDLITRIMAFQGTVSGLRYPLAGELRAAAAKWLEQAQTMRIAAEQAAAGVGATPQVFRAGDPVDRQSEAFVPRYAVVDELAQQALLATGCPGVLLYGRRRTGKSSILKAFDGVLPPNLLSRSASLQDPQVAVDFGRLCGKLANMAADGAGLAERPDESIDLPGLMDILNRADAALAQSGKRLILALDEYERLDGLVGEGRVPMDFLHMLRESIQKHRHLVWLLAGSHHYENLPHVPWTSYLISMRQVDVTMFTDEESRGLLTDPLAFSPLFRNDENRPRFSDAFWGVDAAGVGGVDWIQREAGGWPHLVQLLAERAVEEVNRRTAAAFNPDWRGVVLKRAVAEGAPVFRELLLGTQENRTEAERDYVAAFAHAEAQAAPTDREVRAHLLRREIIARGDDGLWRLRVPLMRRWMDANRDYL
jgi:hypothetical protein